MKKKMMYKKPCLCHPLTGMPGILPYPAHPKGLAAEWEEEEKKCKECGRTVGKAHDWTCIHAPAWGVKKEQEMRNFFKAITPQEQINAYLDARPEKVKAKSDPLMKREVTDFWNRLTSTSPPDVNVAMKKMDKIINANEAKPGQFVNNLSATCVEPEYSMTDEELDVATDLKELDEMKNIFEGIATSPSTMDSKEFIALVRERNPGCDVSDLVKKYTGILENPKADHFSPNWPKSAEDLKIIDISLVKDPPDKKCRITHISIDKVTGKVEHFSVTNVCHGCHEKFDYAEPAANFECWGCRNGF